jgi:hypothetical protein
MCEVEGQMLQQGMNFSSGSRQHSIILMSQRAGAPYPDRMSEDGQTLYYIGHDAYGLRNKSEVDQPLISDKGTLTQNGKFFQAALEFETSGIGHFVRVYEKLNPGIWTFNGLFRLVGAKMEFDGRRKVCVFELRLVTTVVKSQSPQQEVDTSPGRLIPTSVKIFVMKRDRNRCVKCNATKDLHFDHILPFSKGGSSTNPDNIQLLCQKHNLEKSDRID